MYYGSNWIVKQQLIYYESLSYLALKCQIFFFASVRYCLAFTSKSEADHKLCFRRALLESLIDAYIHTFLECTSFEYVSFQSSLELQYLDQKN